MTINNYSPGDGIPPHWDSHSPFEDVFCSLSLGSGVTMSFSLKDEQRHLYIKPRSLLVFSEEARYIWEHSISLRKIDRVEDDVFFRKRRVSLTFRKIRKGECNCIYTNFCDSQIKKLGSITPLSDFNLNTNSSNKGKIIKYINNYFSKLKINRSHSHRRSQKFNRFRIFSSYGNRKKARI